MRKNNEIKTVVPALRFPEFRELDRWEILPIGYLCQILNNQRKPIPEILRVKGPYPYYGASGIVDYINAYIFDEELLLIGEDGAKWGAYENTAYIANGKFWVNNHAHVLRPIRVNIVVLKNYLIQLDLTQYITGAAPPKLTLGKLKEIGIPISKNPQEQQKIADCFSTLDELIEATSQEVDALKEHKKGLMQRLFPAEGKDVPDLRFLEFQGAEEWKESSLDEYFDFKQGFQCPVEEQYDKQEHGMVRFIRIIDLTQPSTPYRYINDPGNQYYINKENLFMVRYGDPGLVGIGYEGIIANNLFQLIPKKKINPYFFYFLFSKEKTRIKGLSSSTSLSAINFTSLKALKIVVSQNTDEQQKIADCFSSIDELIEVISRKVEILKEHKKGLMQQLFPKI